MEDNINLIFMSEEDEKRSGMKIKNIMKEKKLKTVMYVKTYNAAETDKGRYVVNEKPYIFGIPDETKKDAKNTKKKATKSKPKKHSACSWNDIGMNEDTARYSCELCEDVGHDFTNATDCYRYIHGKVFVDTGLCQNYLFTKADGSEPIGRGYLDLFKGKKFPEIVNQYVCDIGGDIKNHPTDDAWINRDVRRGNISSADQANKVGPHGKRSPIYTFDANPNSPWYTGNVSPFVKDLIDKGYSKEEIDIIKKYTNQS